MTAKATADRLTKKASLKFEPVAEPDESNPTVIIDKEKTFQTIVGIGGALTDASAETFYKLPINKQREIPVVLRYECCWLFKLKSPIRQFKSQMGLGSSYLALPRCASETPRLLPLPARNSDNANTHHRTAPRNNP